MTSHAIDKWSNSVLVRYTSLGYNSLPMLYRIHILVPDDSTFAGYWNTSDVDQNF